MNRVIVALDVPRLDDAETLARSLADHVGGFKVGLELMMTHGPGAVTRIAALGRPVFADAKLHDIPSTVERAAAALGRHGARWVTTHAAGGLEMISAAVRGLNVGSGGGDNGVLAVTVLTSLDEEDLSALGLNTSVAEHSGLLARIAHDAGAEGVVCSPHEVPVVKSVSADLLVVTPGIRVDKGDADDQKRIATPAAAAAAGADLLVVGRPITAAPNPVAAAAAIAESLRR